MNSNQSIFYDGMEGMPMRIESKTQEGGMIMEVASIQKESLDPSLFSIPSGFTESKGMFGR